MKGKILITDSLFIFPEHEEKIRIAGYDIERLDKAEATTEELVGAIKGKVGYILGGTEKVTKDVIDAADELKVIAFTGIGYKDFIPAWQYAEEKGISIMNAPDGPTQAVAEWAVGTVLSMNRGFFEISRRDNTKFKTTKGIEGQHVGIVGLGRIGKRISKILVPFRPASISYNSRHEHADAGLKYKSLESLLTESDIIFLCVSKEAGHNYISERELKQIKEGALVVSFMHPGVIDEDALLAELKAGHLRAISDYPAQHKDFNDLPLNTWYSFNASNAFNTEAGLKLTSDLAVEALLAVLEKN